MVENSKIGRIIFFRIRSSTGYKISENLGEALVGIEIDTIPQEQQMAKRGW